MFHFNQSLLYVDYWIDLFDSFYNSKYQEIKMSTPYACPVCGGRGLVPSGFYMAIGVDTWGGSSLAPDTCRSCQGTGIIWCYKATIQGFTMPYHDDNPLKKDDIQKGDQ
jgi:DnaJ-class molecular chaperone